MIKQYRKYVDRRHKSAIKPLLYLIVELVLISIICILVFQLDNELLDILIVVASIYFFITSSLKRYRKVRDRQKYYEE